jgi:multiple sugar transport system permease protein
MNNEKEKQNLEVVENQETVVTTQTLEEQTREAVIAEQNAAELDFMRTKLGFKRVIQRLKDEEGFEVDELAEQKRIERQIALENETVKEDLNRRYSEWKESWQDPTKRKVKAKNTIAILAAFFRTFILVGLCFVILMPIVEKVSFALRAPQDIANKQVIWIPENWSFMNVRVAFSYLTLMKDNSYENIAFLYNISTYFNSVWLSLVTTVIQVISTAIAGYAFARLKFKGSGLIFLLAVLTLIVPSESLATARKLVFFNIPFFGIELLKNSFAIYYMSAFGMGLRSGIFIYLFRQFFRGIPIELEESAEIDGAGVIRTFWSVMLPNARGAIVTVALFSFVWQYNDLYWAQMFEYHDSNVMPLLTTGLASSADTFNSLISTSFQSLVAELGDGIAHNAQFYGLILNTAALLMMLPLIIGYLFVQRLFVESIERTGITGM